ncbi:hypothetical protein DNTS_013353 [Danionella cerebrum]|uniref:UDP-glucuronate decarboxylase n=1 Tax=Danionella cerebrum TaxID=2873325 RepID=A0A553MKR2_9TELE|nr:hypothetical protein DNTS_013353 [Danionella translucida]
MDVDLGEPLTGRTVIVTADAKTNENSRDQSAVGPLREKIRELELRLMTWLSGTSLSSALSNQYGAFNDRTVKRRERKRSEEREKKRDFSQKYPPVKFLSEKDRKRILITGGAGFVGSHLTDKLMMDGHEVTVVDNFFTGRKRNVEHWIGHENFELINHDVVEPLYIEGLEDSMGIYLIYLPENKFIFLSFFLTDAWFLCFTDSFPCGADSLQMDGTLQANKGCLTEVMRSPEEQRAVLLAPESSAIATVSELSLRVHGADSHRPRSLWGSTRPPCAQWPRFCGSPNALWKKDSCSSSRTKGEFSPVELDGLAKRVGARLLLASTSEVYGDPEVHPQNEDYWGHVNPIGPRACYDEGKRVAETMCYAYMKQKKAFIFSRTLGNPPTETLLCSLIPPPLRRVMEKCGINRFI